MSNTARNCICTGDWEGGGGRRRREGGREGGGTRWVGDGDTEGERERERKVGGWKALNVGGVEEDTEIHSSSSAQTQCTHSHAILGYTIHHLSNYIN